jgi:uncharacterized protein YeaO (DUF488 family)
VGGLRGFGPFGAAGVEQPLELGDVHVREISYVGHEFAIRDEAEVEAVEITHHGDVEPLPLANGPLTARGPAGWLDTMASSKTHVQIRRIYEEPTPEDGTRVLVDRLWPRGMSKQRAHLDEWCKQIAPSTELRKWYGHDPDRFDEFRRRYQAELTDLERAAALAHLRELAHQRMLTLLTATKDVDISEAAVLAKLVTC